MPNFTKANLGWEIPSPKIELSTKDDNKKLLEKAKQPKELVEKVSGEKSLKSKKVSIDSKIRIIEENVYKILGKQIDNTIVITNINDLNNYIKQALRSGVISIDTETNNSLDPVTCKLMGLCLYTPGQKQAYIPVNHIDRFTGELLEDQLTELDIKNALSVLTPDNIISILHNAKFDYEVIKCTCGIEIPMHWDTLIAARLINENEKAGLKEQYILHIDPDQEKYSIENLFDKMEYAIFSPKLFSLYAATDSMMTYKLYEYQKPILESKEFSKVYKLFKDIEMPLVKVTAEMELNGVEVDVAYGERLSKKYHSRLDEIDNKIQGELEQLESQISAWKLTPEANEKPKKKNGDGEGKSKAEQLDNPINLASPTQLAILFYDILKVPVVNNKKPRSTGEEELKAIAEKTGLSICKILLERRECVKLISTYIDVIPELSKQWEDHRIRTHFNQMGTDTGRFSSSKPINLQNIPSHEKSIRMLFKARDGYRIIGSDYSAQEPRLTAHYSQDPSMIQAYLDGKDLYAVIAQSMYNNKYEENLEFYPQGTKITLNGKEIICGNKTHKNDAGKNRRSTAKVMLLGILYGMGAKTVSDMMGKSIKEGQELIDNFYKGFKQVKKWIEQTQKSVRELGYVEDWYGRRRNLPDVNLPPYEITYTNGNPEIDWSCFNPLLGCIDRESDKNLISKYKKECESIKYPSQYDEIKSKAASEGITIHSNTNKIALAERQCVNARVQGGAATLTKLAMLNIHNDKELNELGFRLLATVHDEVFGECPEENADKVSDRLVQVMIDTAKPYISVPMKCDPYIVSHWYEDEMLVVLQKEFEDYQKVMDDFAAFDKLCKNHTELTEESLQKAILCGESLSL